MERYLTLIFLITVIIVTPIFAGGGQDNTANEPVELRWAHLGVEGEILTIFADEFAKRVEEQTNGRVKIEVYGNAALGNIEETINSVKNGTIDMAMHDFASLAGFVENLAVFNAPFIYKDAAHSMRVTDPYTSPVMRELNQELIDTAGIRIFANCYRGARQLTANFPVYSPADLSGKKIRGVPLPIWMTMIKGMGAVPTPVQWAELATALATGVVEGQENPLNNIYSGKLYEVQDYIMMTNHMQAIQTCFVNEKSWMKIPQEDREIIEKIAVNLGEESVKWTLDSDDEYKELLEAEGVTFITSENGLQIDKFVTDVLKQVNADYPQWAGLIKEIQAIP
ncbi:hypothetical protein B4O97_18440 [Marispirochaeta aestuarii]|uniref:C4-dicarboxylate ABC transporter substrate-binding protein n=1 Tax=Marispirochaeta aestuarii TaxID=1963862 RepID=A0A1Y1RUD0_9SPIO|nr:TRAP transporter substrate-binding protein [Marispirochaeta aestuarii]ORC30268.1 hypothetical protein B4O97_18440 [Marispirochaeta aestuarii]